MKQKAAFTLIEVLIVFGTIALLALVVLYFINPKELFMHARDSARISALNTLKVTLELAHSSQISLGAANTLYVSIPDPAATSSAGDQCQGLSLAVATSGWTYHCAPPSSYLKVDGTGWLPVNFAAIPGGGSPINPLPVDPINATSGDLYYTYGVTGNNWELTALMESGKDFSFAANSDCPNPGLPALYALGTCGTTPLIAGFSGNGTSTPPALTSLNLVAGPIGTNVTITGSNFAPTGNNITIGTYSLGPATSANGTTLSFTVPPAIPLGTNQVSVANANGSSNTLPFNVTMSASVAVPAFNDMYVSGNYLYGVDFAATNGKMYVVDISNPGAPRLLSSVTIGNGPRYIRVAGQYAYIAVNGDTALAIVNVASSTNPILVSKLAIANSNVRNLDVNGQYAYIAGYSYGTMVAINIASSSNPVEAGRVSSGDLIAGIAAQGNYVYTGGDDNGVFRIVDVSIQANPVLDGNITLPTGITSIALSGHYAFASSFNTGHVSVVDITSTSTPFVAGTVTNTNSSHVDHVFVANGDLYVGGSGALTVWGLSTPSSPNLLDTVPNAVGDSPLFATGSYLYYSDNAGNLVIYDATRW